MIVTRRRRKPFPYRAVASWLALIAIVFFVALFPPSRTLLANGPLAPVYGATDATWTKVAAPFHFAAQNELLTDDNRKIAALQQQVANDKTQLAGKLIQIAQLQGQVDKAIVARTAATVPQQPILASRPGPVASGQPLANDLSAGATPDMKRVAQYWASMDPDQAAAVIQKLPPSYVARIFALMQPDGVGPVLDALPVAFAASVTQEDPGLKR